MISVSLALMASAFPREKGLNVLTNSSRDAMRAVAMAVGLRPLDDAADPTTAAFRVGACACSRSDGRGVAGSDSDGEERERAVGSSSGVGGVVKVSSPDTLLLGVLYTGASSELERGGAESVGEASMSGSP